MKKPKINALPPRPMPRELPKPERPGKLATVRSTTKNRKY